MPWSTSAPATIRTARLRLEPLVVADADELVGVLADPALYRVIGGDPPSLDQLRARYAAMVVGRSPDGTEQWLNWIVRLASGGEAVGHLQATVVDHGSRADVAWVVGTPWQGQGYAGEAARALVRRLREVGVRSVTAHVHPDHVASRAVARHAGLTPTADHHDGEQRWLLAPVDPTPE